MLPSPSSHSLVGPECSALPCTAAAGACPAAGRDVPSLAVPCVQQTSLQQQLKSSGWRGQHEPRRMLCPASTLPADGWSVEQGKPPVGSGSVSCSGAVLCKAEQPAAGRSLARLPGRFQHGIPCMLSSSWCSTLVHSFAVRTGTASSWAHALAGTPGTRK